MNKLQCAENLVLLAESSKDENAPVRFARESLDEVGLRINPSQSQHMVFLSCTEVIGDI